MQLWKPTNPGEMQMEHFRAFVNKRYSLELQDYSQLYQFSITHLGQFWAAVWEFCRVVSSKPYTLVVDEKIRMDLIPTWFKGAAINYAENMLRHEDNRSALIGVGENQVFGQLTFFQLKQRVGQCSRALRASAYMPNCIDAVIYMLAVVSIGAIWSSASPDFGVQGVLDRFQQVDPKILISVNCNTYNGKNFDVLEKLAAIAKGLVTLERVVVVSFIVPISSVSMIPNGVTSESFLAPFPLEFPEFAQLSFEHPLAILYSSGTTGAPKCIVHSHGGALLQHSKEHMIHGNMRHDDVFFYYTTVHNSN